MTISASNLRILQGCARAVADAKQDLNVAQLDLKQAIAMTYLEDHAPMREIAEAAGVSHQRVAQILEEHTQAGR